MVDKVSVGLVSLIAVFALQLLHHWLYQSARVDPLGWRWLRPGFLHYFALLGSAAFGALMWWVYLFVGSERADAASQEIAMLLLASAFSGGAVWVWFTCFLRRYGWAENRFKVRLLRFETIYDLSRLSDIELKHNGQMVVLRFSDGKSISFSADMHGAGDLADHIDQIIF